MFLGLKMNSNISAKEQVEISTLERKLDNSQVEGEVIKLDLFKFQGLADVSVDNDNQEVKVDKPILVSYVRSHIGRGQEELFGDLELKSSYKPILDEDKKRVYINAENTDQEENSVFNDVQSEVLTREEAEVEIKNIQYAQIMGSPMDVDPTTRRKVANWILFNPALFALFESNYAITRDVDYNKFI